MTPNLPERAMSDAAGSNPRPILGGMPMLAPSNAWRILNARTGGAVSRATFYRWLTSGKIHSIRVGLKIFIPWPVIDELIRQCLAGERI